MIRKQNEKTFFVNRIVDRCGDYFDHRSQGSVSGRFDSYDESLAVTLAPVSIQSLAYQQPSDRLDNVVSLAMRVALNNEEGRELSPLFLFLLATSAERTLLTKPRPSAIRLGKMPDHPILLLVQDANYPVIRLARLF